MTDPLQDLSGSEALLEPEGAVSERLEVGTPTHFRWLHTIVAGVLLMNLIDAVLTLWWVRTGFATEANPLLRDIVNEHALLFVMGKLALVSLGTALLWRQREHGLAVVGIFSAFLTYYFVLLFHLRFMSHILRQLY
jgi:hypothetical protein